MQSTGQGAYTHPTHGEPIKDKTYGGTFGTDVGTKAHDPAAPHATGQPLLKQAPPMTGGEYATGHTKGGVNPKEGPISSTYGHAGNVPGGPVTSAYGTAPYNAKESGRGLQAKGHRQQAEDARMEKEANKNIMHDSDAKTGDRIASTFKAAKESISEKSHEGQAQRLEKQQLKDANKDKEYHTTTDYHHGKHHM